MYTVQYTMQSYQSCFPLNQETLVVEDDEAASGHAVRKVGATIVNELGGEDNSAPTEQRADDEGPASKNARHAEPNE